MPIVNQETATRFVKELESAWKHDLVSLTGEERHFIEGAWRHHDKFSERQIWFIIDLMMYYAGDIGFDFEQGKQEAVKQAGECQREGVPA